MTTYALGDIQGCFQSLQRLLANVGFHPSRDRLWLVGDLVNRGPDSLAVLRWALKHDANISAVLGNHDLHLLAAARGLRKSNPLDTLDAVLTAPDRDQLLEWLRQRPFLHRDGDTLMVHAGLAPAWSADTAEGLARQAAEALRDGNGDAFLGFLASHRAQAWDDGLQGDDRLATAVALLTRLRTCDAAGRPASRFKGPPAEAPEGYRPWFDWPDRRTRTQRIVFGHWAAGGLQQAPGILGLDTGCVWGGSLTAADLSTGELHHEPAAESR